MLFFAIVRDEENQGEIILKTVPIGVDTTTFMANVNEPGNYERSLRMLSCLASPYLAMMDADVAKDKMYGKRL